MYANVLSATPVGIEARLVTVEVQVSQGMPATLIVGLADPVTRESRERVLAAIQSCGHGSPSQRVVINLAPADVRKVGSSLDLPIALSLLMAQGRVSRRRDERMVAMGELSLSGAIKPVPGVLVMADAARRHGIRRVMVPVGNVREATLVEGLQVVAVATLTEAIEHLCGDRGRPAAEACATTGHPGPGVGPDFADVEGQPLSRRALEIAAAGGHNVLMIGPPGVGKTMLAQRLPGILPDLTFEEAIEVTKIHSVAGLVGEDGGMLWHRPFRSPHHTMTAAGLVGGGPALRPGDVSLAHRGVLFLDEFSEFARGVLELLRQPLEDRSVHLSRAARRLTYPASFMLVASMNPCPCGYRGSPRRACVCTPPMVRRHWQKLSGPLLDRMDLVLDVPPVPVETIARGCGGEPTGAIRARVSAARAVQAERYRGTEVLVNAELTAPLLRRFAAIEPDAAARLQHVAERAGMSARGFHRAVKVARSIADLDGSPRVATRHVAEALAFRLADAEVGPGAAAAAPPPIAVS